MSDRPGSDTIDKTPFTEPDSTCDICSMELDNECSGDDTSKEAYLPNMQDADELSVDETAYEYLEQLETSSSFLSFDLIPVENLVANNSIYDFYFVYGTQADAKIVVSKISGVHPLDVDDFDSQHKKPQISNIGFSYSGGINRIRKTEIEGRNFVASWSENGFVGIWDVSHMLFKVQNDKCLSLIESEATELRKPLVKSEAHRTEGYAIDWCKTVPKRLACGDRSGIISVFSIETPNSFVKLQANSESVEDLQWSNQEENVLASCGCDSTVRIWDCRANSQKSVSHVQASDCDINVISWSKFDPFILSGDDKGALKVWDLRKFHDGPVAFFNFHKGAITSVEWHPMDSSCFAASSDDKSVTQWDLTAELDKEKRTNEPDVPPQLLFIHMCLNEPKELHWHTLYPGFLTVCTQDSFELFKTVSV